MIANDGRNEPPLSELSLRSDQYSIDNAQYASEDDGDLSLVPASSVEDEDASYVIPSAPTSLNTFPETRSVESLVMVGHGAEESLNSDARY